MVKHIQFRFALTSPKAEKHRRETGAIWIVLSGSSEQYYYSYQDPIRERTHKG